MRASSVLFGQTIGTVLLLDAAGAITCNSTFLGAGTCGSTDQDAFISNSVNVPLNVLVQLALFIDVERGGGCIGTSGSADFSNSLDLPIGSDVFNLAAGVAANSTDLGIVDNRFKSATRCPPLPLFATGLGDWSACAGAGNGTLSPPDPTLDQISERPPRGGLSVFLGPFANVRYWHKADMPSCTAHVRFWG